MQLTPAISNDAGLSCESSRSLKGGSVEIVYACAGSRGELPAKPVSQR
jgi:hypothetical protein